MTTINEIEINLTRTLPGTSYACPKVHLMVDGVEYMLIGGRGEVTVLSGRWCHDRRSPGKTFWSKEALVSNYKRHGSILAEYAVKLGLK